MPADLPARHHYIPVFYLKQWMASDRRICEYQRHHGDIVKPRRTHPSGTGYVRGLYDLVGIDDPEHREAFEREFLKPVDTRAAELLQDINAGRKAMNNQEKRSAWTRFLLSLLLRMPEDIKFHKERYIAEWMRPDPDRAKYYKRIWRPGLPNKLEDVLAMMDLQEIEHRAMDALIPLMTNPRIGQYIINMHWGSMTLPPFAPALLTSDRPLLMSDGLMAVDSHIIMPVGPKTIFYAVNDQRVLNFLMIQPPSELATTINVVVASQAIKYVYGQWDVQLPLVKQHMGSNRVPSLLERMQANRSKKKIVGKFKRKAKISPS